jgi:hypothetical protein
VVPAPGKGKHAHVILHDDEVSFDEDEPLQKRLRRLFRVAGLSGSGPALAAPDVVAAADKEVVDQKAAVARAAKEAAEKAVADKEAADKSTSGEVAVKGAAVGAVGDSLAPDMAPSLVARTKRAATPSGSTPPAKQLYRGIWKPRFILLGFFVARLHFEYISFSHNASSSGAATVMDTPAPTVGTTIAEHLSGRLQGRLPAVSLRPLRGSFKTCWRNQRKRQRWH